MTRRILLNSSFLALYSSSSTNPLRNSSSSLSKSAMVVLWRALVVLLLRMVRKSNLLKIYSRNQFLASRSSRNFKFGVFRGTAYPRPVIQHSLRCMVPPWL